MQRVRETLFLKRYAILNLLEVGVDVFPQGPKPKCPEGDKCSAARFDPTHAQSYDHVAAPVLRPCPQDQPCQMGTVDPTHHLNYQCPPLPAARPARPRPDPAEGSTADHGRSRPVPPASGPTQRAPKKPVCPHGLACPVLIQDLSHKDRFDHLPAAAVAAAPQLELCPNGFNCPMKGSPGHNYRHEQPAAVDTRPPCKYGALCRILARREEPHSSVFSHAPGPSAAAVAAAGDISGSMSYSTVSGGGASRSVLPAPVGPCSLGCTSFVVVAAATVSEC
jgi:hypothetical protein